MKNIISLQTILNSYAQVFFSKNRILGIILLFVSFFDFWTGISGLFAVLVGNQVALWFKFYKEGIKSGQYGFNILLVGLGVGIVFQPSFSLMLIIIAMSILTLFITLTIEGIFTKYGIPFLSIPFLLVMWIMSFAINDLSYIGISERGIYLYNELYKLGGQNFVDLYSYLQGIETPQSLRIYFLSLAAIFFQFNELAGILIALALLFSSRIAFTLSLVGFYIAYSFYLLLGANFSELSYTYIGFNYILTAIAVSGFFFVPSRWSYLWLLLLLPITVIITFGLNKFFMFFQLPIYSLPFNIVVLLFIYVMKLRTEDKGVLVEPIEQLNSPEENLYFHINYTNRFPSFFYLPAYLPFMGEWTVSQAHNGEHTHKGAFKHAWDFVITNSKGKQFQNSGDYCTDYFCYNKPVLAVAEGVIEELTDGIKDNIIGDNNTINNWGNSIVIKHSDYLYSQVSHLKTGSFKVKKGDYVQKGQIIAMCGNSGRSPYPHLHFQFQITPYIGSPTFEYPFAHIIRKSEKKLELKDQYFAEKGDVLSNTQANELVERVFHFIPGQVIKFRQTENSDKQIIYKQIEAYHKEAEIEWEVKTDSNNISYFFCRKTKSEAYFKIDELMFQFTDFDGDKNSFLYKFYLTFYKVQFGYYENLEVEDFFPQNKTFSAKSLFFQDFLAPFYLFLKAKYNLKYLQSDDMFSPSEIKLETKITKYSFKKKTDEINVHSTISQTGFDEIKIKSGKQN